jgi:hypothetical protein
MHPEGRQGDQLRKGLCPVRLTEPPDQPEDWEQEPEGLRERSEDNGTSHERGAKDATRDS